MYTSFYNLAKKPFELHPDLSFLWLGEKDGGAFSVLRSGIITNKGFLLVTGKAGSGKTTLVKALTESLDDTIVWAVIADPQRERIDFYNAIAKGFGLGGPFASKVQFLIQFSQFLHKAYAAKKKVLLLVDDCHLLSQEMLEELRLLANIAKADVKLLNIFFAGQPAFNAKLAEPKNRAVDQRLTLKANLLPLTADEVGDYIRHRLKVAGTEEKVFSAQAIQAICLASRGLPRRINALCDHALAIGAVQNRKIIDDKMIEVCVREMGLSAVPPETASLSGFNLKTVHRYGWIKYVFGLLVIGALGVYFSFPTLHSGDNGSEDRLQAGKAPVVERVPQAIGSSPAVVMLEKNKGILDAQKVAELKTAILENAYNNSEEARAGKKLQTTQEKTNDAAPPAVPARQPLEPRKMMLELQPNVLKLTNAAAEEFASFVEKLKLYPQATIKVKGFVSGQSNAPENIRVAKEQALHVQKLLQARGIDSAPIEVVGPDGQDPIAFNSTSEERGKNGRVEIVVIDDGVSGSGGK